MTIQHGRSLSDLLRSLEGSITKDIGAISTQALTHGQAFSDVAVWLTVLR